MSFVHLHTHSHYSILEWLPKPASYVKKAFEMWMPWIALTDTSNIYGCHELYKAAKDVWIKAILGTEIYTQSSVDPKLSHKLVLLAKNYNGYKNIIELTTSSHLSTTSKTSLPILSFDTLKQYSQDIICLSGPVSSEISYYLLSGKSTAEVVERIAFYQSIFGKENYYLELLSHDDIPKQNFVTQRLIEINKEFSVPVVATNNTYYIDKQDKETQDVIVALWTGYEIENPDRPTFINGDYSFLWREEMEVLFGYIPESLDNSLKICQQIDLKIPTGKPLMPVYELPEEHATLHHEFEKFCKEKELWQTFQYKHISSDEFYLRYLCFLWFNWRYKTPFSHDELFLLSTKKSIEWLTTALQDTSIEALKSKSLEFFSGEKIQFLSTLSPEIYQKIERLEYELFVVHEMWFDAYFLIVSDYINWARKNSIPVWPGRWSAAGALLAYLSGITDLDPLEYDLLFERFLNPARVSMPDIDTDFSDDGRDRVVDYCKTRYGADRVSQICTFGTFAARAAVKDVGRVRGVPFAEMNEFAKLIPEKPGTKLRWALEDSPDFKKAYAENALYKAIIDDALKIEGNVRQLWVHACAVIIAPESITHFTALQHPPKDNTSTVTQYSAYPLEDLGLLKMDFLGLRNLTIIQRTIDIVKRVKGVDIDILNVNVADPKVFEVFAKADTTGIFQFESSGMRSWLKPLKPSDINDVIAMVALYRPGPMQFIEHYIKRKFWEESVDYMYEDLAKDLEKKYGKNVVEVERKKLFEDLGPFMDVTYGIAVYQEQLMRLVQSMAWFSLAEADMLRRWVGKKKKDVIEKIRHEFIDKAEKYREYKKETSDYIYEKMIMPAADYSFNKSHAACYAFIAYQTAFLKAYYPTEFLTSLLTSDEEDLDRIAMEVEEVKSQSINMLPPSVQESFEHFTYIDDQNIRFGLKAIKWVGEGPIQAIIAARKTLDGKKFASLEEFIEVCGKEVINKKTLESLIKAWAMDELSERNALLDNIEEIIRFSRTKEEKKESSQIGLFDMMGDTQDSEKLVLKATRAHSFEETLFNEKEVLGFMVSGHPLDGLKKYVSERTANVKYLRLPIEKTKEMFDALDEKGQQKMKDDMKKPCKALGLVLDVRKIFTKTWKNMMILLCEGFDYNFEVTVFDRDYDKFNGKIQVGNIIVVDGNVSIDFAFWRKAVQARDCKVLSVSQARDQAKAMGAFDTSKRALFIVPDEVVMPPVAPVVPPKPLSDDDWEEVSEDSMDDVVEAPSTWEFEVSLETAIVSHMSIVDIDASPLAPSEYTVKISPFTKKELLQEFKSFLYTLPKGNVKIWLEFKWQKIDTQTSVDNSLVIQEWEKKNLQETFS